MALSVKPTEAMEDAVLIAELQRRIAGDSGNRISLDEVMAGLGITTEDLDEPDCSIQDRCCCGPQPDDRVRFHQRGSDECGMREDVR